jgi:signal transduction histidine kinase/ActR/RegA family two-component response regulator
MKPWAKMTSPSEGPAASEREVSIAAGVVFVAAMIIALRAAFASAPLVLVGPAIGMAVTAVVAALLASRGLVRAGACLMVAGIMIGAALMVFVEGPYSIRLGLFFVGLAVAGLTFGPVPVVVLGVLVAAAYWGLDLAAARGLLGPYEMPEEPRAPAFAVQVIAMAVLTALIVRVRRKVRHEAAQGEERVVELIRRTPFGMALVDGHRRLRSLNPALADAVGSTPVQLQDRRIDDVGLGVLFDCAIARAGEPLEMWLGKARTPRWVEASIRQLESDEGTAWLLVVRDVEPLRRAEAERRELEQQLEQARRLEALGRLAGGVAHDFNNLLQVILAQADLLNSGLPAPTAPAEILAAAERAEEITRQLLTFARGQHDAASEVELDAVVRATSPLLRRLLSPGVDIEMKLDAPGTMVPLSRAQLDQILLNLITNGQDAMPEGGTLTVATHREEDSRGGFAVLMVTDTGIGMEADLQARVFEPFFTTKELGRGTGLGLSTVHGIVGAAGGEVRLRSEAGSGTEVKVLLPEAIARPSEAALPAREGEALRLAGRTVLLVDDDEQVRSSVADQLDRIGCLTFTAADGDAAEAIARLHPEEIDLVISDMILRRESGPEVAARLSRVIPSVEVLYMSGYPAGVLAWYGLEDAGERMLPKPFTTDELKRRLQIGLEKTERRREERRLMARRAG